MAVSKKGWRKISAHDKPYYWRAIGTDWGIDCVVITDKAFVRGQSSQQLRFSIDYGHLRNAASDGIVSLRQQAVISPAVIRRAIEIGSTKTPPFDGAVGQSNIMLGGDDISKLQYVANKKSHRGN